jgi:GDP-4-dehydro-6-deoxy-D-mannose reductase
MRKVLITGIFGSAASYMVEYLREHQPDVEIHGIGRWHTDRVLRALDGVRLIECDLNDLGSVIGAVKSSGPDYILHLASHANVRASFDTPVAVFENNVKGTLNLFEALRITHRRPVVLIASTSEVYGQLAAEDCPVSENHATNPANIYAVSKLTQEKIALTYAAAHHIAVVITRAFGYINPRRPDIFSSAFARQIVEIERGQRSTLAHGNLDSTRTLLDVRDVCAAYWTAVTSCEWDQVYNIGSTAPITVREFLESIKGLSTGAIPTALEPRLLRSVDVTMQIPDVRKFASTGWKPVHSFSESLAFLLDHYR